MLGREGLDGGHELGPHDEELAEGRGAVGQGKVDGGLIQVRVRVGAVLGAAGEGDGGGVGGRSEGGEVET